MDVHWTDESFTDEGEAGSEGKGFINECWTTYDVFLVFNQPW